MKNATERQPPIEKELGKYRMAAPSTELRDRILKAARQAMTTRDAGSGDIPWIKPALRFAACVTIAFVLVLTGTVAGNYVGKQQQPLPFDRQIPEMDYLAQFMENPILFKISRTVSQSEKFTIQNIVNARREIQRLLSSSD